MFGAFMMRILPTLVAALAGLLIAGGSPPRIRMSG